jgi:hypothetical protein
MISMGNMKETSATGLLEAASKAKTNCWEHKKCGRQPGGPKAAELGICPVTTYADLNGAHGGKNAGRACWVIAGSLCGGKIQGTYAMKLLNCWRCEFMNSVKQEEDPMPLGFSHTRLGMDRTLEKLKGALGIAAQEPTSEMKHR